MSKLQFHWEEMKNYKDVFDTLIQRFRLGDHITDFEVRELIKHYTCLEKMLFAEGERFHHAWRDASDQVRRLIEMQEARRKK